MADFNVEKTQPSKSEIITVESKLYHEPKSDTDHPKVGGLYDCVDGATGWTYCTCCLCGLCFPLLTACFLGQDMGDKWAICKYGIPGKLNRKKLWTKEWQQRFQNGFAHSLVQIRKKRCVIWSMNWPHGPSEGLIYSLNPYFQWKALLLTVCINLMYFFAVTVRVTPLEMVVVGLIVRISVIIMVTAILIYQRRYVSYYWSLIYKTVRLQILLFAQMIIFIPWKHDCLLVCSIGEN